MTYEYECSCCGHRWEATQRLNDPPLTTCPKCLVASAKKLVSATSFVLKGGGWAADGYGKTQ
jgi:putative FmdB family regulatory protein